MLMASLLLLSSGRFGLWRLVFRLEEDKIPFGDHSNFGHPNGIDTIRVPA